MKLLYKDALIKIRKTLGRFLSILFIVALGIGFFAGLRETAPDMLTTLDKYYDDTNFMDFKIVSTMGLTANDLTSLEKLENVDKVIPSYSVDALVEGEAIRIHALEKNINQVQLVEGTMPSNDYECVADITKYKIGDTISISKLSIDGILKNIQYQVVGLIRSPLYVARQMGIAQVGSGKLQSFIFIPKNNFDSKYYTEIYLTASNSKKGIAYQKDYEKQVDKLNKELLKLKPIRETKRYEEIMEEATREIEKVENELEAQKKATLSKLDKAKNELEVNRKKLDNAKLELSKGSRELQKQEELGQKKIAEGKVKLNMAEQQFLSSLGQYGIDSEELDFLYSSTNEELKRLEKQLLQLDENDPLYQQYYEKISELKEQSTRIEMLITNRDTLKANKQELINQEATYKTQIASRKDKLTNSRQELNAREEQYQQGLLEYQKATDEFNNKIAKANKEIATAREKLQEIEKPEWYLINRTNQPGYTSVWQDATKVDSIAQVFPLFFILVVALMCFNTMNRMIEEERGEIGILSSLGYNKFKIMSGYLFYVFLATIIGVFIGLTVGYTVIPNVIYQIYHANYILPPLIMSVKIGPFLILVFSALFLMFAITIISCLKELRNYPAIILRPKAPKVGKKVMLEYISFIWKRLSFTSKVTVRNMFRYKKRIVMTILGVAGCSALLLTGFGLRDSISKLSSLQYGNIIRYDSLFVFEKNFKEIDTNLQQDFKNEGVTTLMPIFQESYTFNAKGLSHDVYLVTVSDTDNLSEFISLNSRNSNKKVKINDDGVIITEKMASLLKAKVGGYIKIRNSQNELFLLKVSDIIENYTQHYIYISKNYYEQVFNRDLEYNMVMANLDTSINYDKLSTHFIDEGLVSTINYTHDNIMIFDKMIKGLNQIVYLIIGASCMLVFIVLYNLTTINITERIREISTLKVLGFYDNEVSSYVYRETFILTIIGIIVGLFLGIGLHNYVMTVAETDEILFLRLINWSSYVLSFVITIFFGILVQIFTYQKLKKIDMIEALKSVE